jgi:DNA-binding transcriptional LysR family regulator
LETLARHHVGPDIASEWLIGSTLARGELVQILPEGKGPDMELWVVWPNHDYQSGAARAFLDWVIPTVLE